MFARAGFECSLTVPLNLFLTKIQKRKARAKKRVKKR
jgi:hypothetical protein